MVRPSIKTDAIFDAARDCPALVERLFARVPGLRETLDELRSALPIPDSTSAGRQGRFLRLPTHYRSVCLSLTSDGWSDPLSAGHVIVLKGTEPAIAGFDEYLLWMMTARFRKSELPMGLHFPLALRMPPGAMPIDECIREQKISTTFQERYVERFGELARTPIPLLTHRMDREVVDRYLAQLKHALPAQALERVEQRARAGLGVAVYYYEGLPLRVSDLQRGGDGSTPIATDLSALSTVIGSWVELFARMLSLGYVPFAHWNKGWGACVDRGNACVNGGFADLLTLVSLTTMPSERVLRASVWSSVNLLIETVTTLWAVSRGAVDDEEVKTLVGLYVRQQLLERVAQIEAAGHAFDGRVRTCLSVDSLQDLASLTRPVDPAPTA